MNTIIAIYEKRAVVYRAEEDYKFAVVALKDKPKRLNSKVESYQIGEMIDSWISDTDIKRYKTAEKAILSLHSIKYSMDALETITADLDSEKQGLFVCNACGEVLDLGQKCIKHYDKNESICVDCCECCKDELAYWDHINTKFEHMVELC